jgi:hypothetical protein
VLSFQSQKIRNRSRESGAKRQHEPEEIVAAMTRAGTRKEQYDSTISEVWIPISLFYT